MSVSTSERQLERYVLLLGGIASVVFSILLFSWTEATLAVIMLLIGLSWLIQGLFSIMAIFVDKTGWGWNLFSGIIGVIAGVLVLGHPLQSTVILPAVLAIIIGILGILIGVIALIGAFQGGGWGSGIFGAITLVIGLLFLFNSVVGGQVLVWLMALLLLIQGAIGIFFGLKK
jgi:uncharacterized membrane protein HdeD (DUF308 family)